MVKASIRFMAYYWMGERLRTGKPPQYFTQPPRPTQPPTLRWTGNEYQPKCGDAFRLGSKSTMAHCDPFSRAIPERLRDESLTIKRYANLWLL